MHNRNTKFRISKLTASKPNTGINIPGFSKVLNPNTSIHVRLFWTVIVACCAATCFHQLSERVGTYLDFATTLDMFVIRNQTITFPAITICPTLHSSIRAVVAALKFFILKACNNTNSYMQDKCPHSENFNITEYNFNFTDLRITDDDLWESFAIEHDLISAAVPGEQFEGPNNHTPLNATYSNITTYWGLCVVITPAEPMEYRGPYTYVRIRVNRTGVMFFLSNKGIEQRHDAFFLAEPLYDKRFSDIRLGTKQFNFLNTTRDPCMEEADVVECRNRCIDKLMDKALNCKVKFMINSKLKPCSTIRDLAKAHLTAQKTYAALKSGECSCMRKCKETLFSVTTDVAKHLNESETHFLLYYPDNLHEIVQESYAYSLSALLSDVGGTFGFYLGFCVVTVIEIVEGIIRKSAKVVKTT